MADRFGTSFPLKEEERPVPHVPSPPPSPVPSPPPAAKLPPLPAMPSKAELRRKRMLQTMEKAVKKAKRDTQNLSDKCIDEHLDAIRKMAEEYDCLEGFIVYAGLGGGTGSGLTTSLL